MLCVGISVALVNANSGGRFTIVKQYLLLLTTMLRGVMHHGRGQ